MLNLSALKKFTRVRKYPAGAVVARVGSAELLIVLKGEAAVYVDHRPSGMPDATLGPGDLFGETALFLGAPQACTVVAVSDVFALTLDRESILPFLREEPEMAYELIKILCARGGPGGSFASHQTEPSVRRQWPPAASSPASAPAAQPVAAPQPAPSVAASVDSTPHPAQSGPSPLFPVGHGSYLLSLNNGDDVHLMDKGYVCPVCKKEFKTRKVKASKLIVASTDRDMRIRYQNVEPLYYDVATCPNCLYSALIDMFASPDIVRPDLRRELNAFQPDTPIRTGEQLDTFSVFAGYYLALFCAPKCFTSHRLAEAKLLLKLNRVYQDCGDGAMELATAQKALDAYLYIYLNEDNGPEQDQQLCAILGELYIKQGDLKNARDYYFKAKTSRDGSQVIKTQAENRLVDIREMERAKNSEG